MLRLILAGDGRAAVRTEARLRASIAEDLVANRAKRAEGSIDGKQGLERGKSTFN
jgi:hypothetical protein